MDIDNAWEIVRNRKCGHFQVLYLITLSLPIMYCAMPALAFLFTAAEIDHRCLIPECETSLDYEFDSDFLNFTTPNINDHYDKVNRYKPVVTPDGDCLATNFDQNKTQICDEWVWRPPEYTIHQEWGFTGSTARNNRMLVAIINNCGQFGSYFFIGFLSDEIGRRSTLVYACMVSSAMGLIRSFSPSFIFLLVFEFFDTMCVVGVYSCCVVLALEILGPRMRIIGGALIGSYYAIGEILLGVLAYQIFYWRNLLRAITIPALFLCLLNWILPDSIIWLVSKGRNEEAIAILYRAARLNRVPITDEITESIHLSISRLSFHFEQQEPMKQKDILKKLVKSKILVIRLICLSFIWITVSLVYYGLSHNSVSLTSGNKYENYIVVIGIEFPSYILLGLIGNFIQRRYVIASSLTITGLGCISSIFPTSEQGWLILVLFLIGKFFITITFAILQVYGNEMFPTPIRNTCIGFCATMGQVGSLLAPLSPALREFWVPFPLIVFGCMAIVSALVSLKFPETRGTTLPATIEQAEKLGRREQIDHSEDYEI